MVTNGEDAAIVRALVDLGHRLGKTIVAEGVEDEKTLDLLTDWGCDTAQGYHLCRPGPSDQITSWLLTSPFGCANGSSSQATEPIPRPKSVPA